MNGLTRTLLAGAYFLTGRMEIFDLWPLSRAEISGSTINLVDALFTPELAWPAPTDTDVMSAVLTGGYPEAWPGAPRDAGRPGFPHT